MEYLYTDDVLILHQDDIHPGKVNVIQVMCIPLNVSVEFAFDLLTLADQFLVDDLKRSVVL